MARVLITGSSDGRGLVHPAARSVEAQVRLLDGCAELAGVVLSNP